jgi:lipoprotein-anchoring transpeptidase ErfK/SrfK
MSLSESTEFSDAAYPRFCAFPRRVRPAGLAEPLQLLPSAFATHERANGGAAVQAQPQSTAGRPRYAEPSQPQFGGGFIELLFGGAARQFVAPRPYQPALPDDRSQAAPTPVTLRMPVLNYAPSAFGNMAHPPVDPKFDRQVVAYRGEEKPGTIVIDTPNRFLYLVEGRQQGHALRHRRRPSGFHLGPA